jgi:hypothetical protein
MAHTMIVGQTESGKTIAAKRLACDQIKQGFSVLILDPIRDPEWYEIAGCQPNEIGENGFVTDDPWRYDYMVWHSQRCFLIIDEAGDHAGHQDKQFFPWATRSRHLGHSAVFIAQRAQMIAPTIRNQCRFLLMFNQSMTDADILSKEFNQLELKNGALPQFEYYYACRFKPVVKGRVDIINDWRQYLCQ